MTDHRDGKLLTRRKKWYRVWFCALWVNFYSDQNCPPTYCYQLLRSCWNLISWVFDAQMSRKTYGLDPPDNTPVFGRFTSLGDVFRVYGPTTRDRAHFTRRLLGVECSKSFCISREKNKFSRGHLSSRVICHACVGSHAYSAFGRERVFQSKIDRPRPYRPAMATGVDMRPCPCA